jgi:hypothetical protein
MCICHSKTYVQNSSISLSFSLLPVHFTVPLPPSSLSHTHKRARTECALHCGLGFQSFTAPLLGQWRLSAQLHTSTRVTRLAQSMQQKGLISLRVEPQIVTHFGLGLYWAELNRQNPTHICNKSIIGTLTPLILLTQLLS